ncbi:MAG TPA: energy transducer TonB [Gemmatimonadaceae bacterium]|nr:energy transducer TonB [Gemmatimonadaceae bacterium]
MRPATVFPLALATLLASTSASALRAQASDQVYAGEELDTPPRLANPARTARLVTESYPPLMKKTGVAGEAQVKFVVDTAGKVEPGSVEVVLATRPAFAMAAKGVAARIEFTPGRANGQPVRARVILPIQYK